MKQYVILILGLYSPTIMDASWIVTAELKPTLTEQQYRNLSERLQNSPVQQKNLFDRDGTSPLQRDGTSPTMTAELRSVPSSTSVHSELDGSPVLAENPPPVDPEVLINMALEMKREEERKKQEKHQANLAKATREIHNFLSRYHDLIPDAARPTIVAYAKAYKLSGDQLAKIMAPYRAIQHQKAQK